MLNNPDAIRVAEAVGACSRLIADSEQVFHSVERARFARERNEDIDAFIAILEEFAIVLDRDVERRIISEDMFAEAPRLDVEALLSRAYTICPIKPSSPTAGAVQQILAAAVVQAQLLDAWLEPAFNPFMEAAPAQAAFRDAFTFDGHVTLSDGSLLLPRRRGPWRNDFDPADDDEGSDGAGSGCEEDGHIGLFARYLRNITVLPGELPCDDPDNLTCVGLPIKAGYLLWNSPALTAKSLPLHPVIAVAPLAERGGDVTFVPSACRTTYAMALNYDEDRLSSALDQAHDAGADIVLVPEMALPEGDAETFNQRIGDRIFDARADYRNRTGQTPSVRLVLAGVLGSARHDGLHRNYAVAFDANGNRMGAFEQRKLSHWNLSRAEQERFGIDHHHPEACPLSDPIRENSLPADSLTILEIPGVGRTATLICADMSQNNPGDWLAVNAILDWLYAPIMDKSICWETSDARREPRPWIVRRVYRAARLTRTVVMATNSMSLTRWINQANERRKIKRYLDPVGLGLAIDGRCSPPTHARVLAGVNERNILKLFERRTADWKIFPPHPEIARAG